MVICSPRAVGRPISTIGRRLLMVLSITSCSSDLARSSASIRATGSTHPASQILKVERLEFNVLILIFEVPELRLVLSFGSSRISGN
ncbi:hypothetical protein VCRA2119O240_180105 [Vibrio crassostreae]|nr:hypothetical protein VCRA2110O180_170105 [Vibrio crassostreae]CAK1804828.1 hypothetical protein VCRA2110O181_170105 [Vibrio crassostreae]CAK1805241.1 hypothetical protein VCRA2113O204_170106 [Vibrio crassostreae]CAK1806818.1 hypothetical protein VCRA2113O220_180002 [Vibrio crassostreae]CAK1809611.1 hypothetical protein VCRA2113O201_180002 [Vibrio crassostreae]